MARPKTIVQRVEIDTVQRAHNCQHDQNHRLERGDKRLKVWRDRSAEHFCVTCALDILTRDIAKLEVLAQELGGPSSTKSGRLLPGSPSPP